jgi:hypothetical protein
LIKAGNLNSRILVVVLFSILMVNSISAQVSQPADTIQPPDIPPNHSKDTVLAIGSRVDIVDILKLIVGARKNPFRKKPEKKSTGPFFTVVGYPGYAIATGVAGVAAVNISFRTKKNPHGSLSFFNNNFQYTQKNQILIQSLSNIYSNNEKWQFPGDIRFFNFPTTTYGLGSSTLPADADNILYSHFRFYRTVYRNIVPYTFMGLGYNFDYHWNINDYGAQNGITDFIRYGFNRYSISSGPSLNFLYDSRDNNNRPTDGTYVNLQFISYLKPLGSTNNWNTLIIDMRKYFPLTKKWYVDLCVWGYAWFTLSGKPPYLDMPSLGWDSYNNTGRGYAAGRFRGRNMLYLETELRFDILRNGLLGLVVFGNASTFTEFGGKYFGPIQPGGGLGLRIKFNKHTNSNSCLDYGFGTHNSRGFATNLNEVF